jgi:hypothetical protein
LVFTLLVGGLVSFGISPAGAAEIPAGAAFKDPYNGGIKLAEGGGEPGKAYMAFIDAAYRKDHGQACKLIADPAEVEPCLQQKEALDGYMALFTQPKSHKVLGGFTQGDEATLNVAYTFDPASESTGFVVMKQMTGKWVISSFGGSGSTNISAEASASVDLATGSVTGSASAGQLPEAEQTGPLLGKWAFEGKDDKGALWTGSLIVSEMAMSDPTMDRTLRCALDRMSENSSSGVEADCQWDPVKRQVSFGSTVTYSAMLSADRKSMTQGEWTETAKDWDTGKVTILGTGTWSAECPECVSAGSAGVVVAPAEFAVINITAKPHEYIGKCPANITFSADITFKMPLPEKISYRWELSNGKKLKDKVVKPPASGQMTVRQVWRGGKSGEELDASVRFVAEVGDTAMMLDPPGVKVICK